MASDVEKARQDELKLQVAKAAVEYVKSGIIGVGTGSTANFFIEELAKVKHKLMVRSQVVKPLRNVCVVMELRYLI